MSTPLRASSLRTTYRALACATIRAFAKVKSSAMMPRQPSVPNLIAVIGGPRKVYAKRYLPQTVGLAVVMGGAHVLRTARRHQAVTIRGSLDFFLPAI